MFSLSVEEFSFSVEWVFFSDSVKCLSRNVVVLGFSSVLADDCNARPLIRLFFKMKQAQVVR